MTNENTDPVLLDIPMPIRTPRLLLRPPQAGDGAMMHEAKKETRDILSRWMLWAKEDADENECEAIVRKAHASFILRTDMMIFGFEKVSGEFLLSCGLHRLDWNIRRFEIGYWVRKNVQGQGYATECANALTRYAFEVLNANAVSIEVAEGNDASMAVVEKLGFEKEGIKKKSNMLPSGEIVDHHLWSCTRTDILPSLTVNW
jgi:RimJ/RimL family protein N-acetyltransferase